MKAAEIGHADIPSHCQSMTGLIGESFVTGFTAVGALISGSGDFSAQLFFAYGDPNNFTLGPLFHIVLIAGFFFFISQKMHALVNAARENAALESTEIARPLMRELSINGNLTVIVVMLGGLATTSVNFFGVYLVTLFIFWLFQTVRRNWTVS